MRRRFILLSLLLAASAMGHAPWPGWRLESTSLKNSSGTLLNRHACLYDDAHRPTQQTFAAGNTLDYGYDALSQLTSAVGKESGGASRAHEQFTYGFDAAGNLSSRVNNGLTQTFTVTNVLNQLDAVSRSGTLTVAGLTTPVATNVTVNSQSATLYGDDSFARAGLSLTDGNNTFTAVATDALGRSASDSVTVNLPAAVSYTYDANGNLTDAGTLDYGYDDANQLTSITEAEQWKSEFVYDGLGRLRLRREYQWRNSAWVLAEEHRYVYDRRLVLQERDANNVPRVSYTRGPDLSGSLQGAGGIGGLLARTDHGLGTHAYYHADGMGNVTALTDENQQVVARYAYDPFGNLQGLNGPLAEANEYRFSSKLWHAASGLYAYGYRFYSPSLQRWLNRDPLGEAGGINLYGFVGNSPSGYVDAMGLLTVITIGLPTGDNPFGHAAIATTGCGVVSFGTGTQFGSSFTDYINNQSTYRSTMLYVLNTTPAQEQAINDYLATQQGKPIDTWPDNCATRTDSALGAAGIELMKSITAAPSVAIPIKVHITPGLPAEIRSALELTPSVLRISIPQNTTLPPRFLTGFDPKKASANPPDEGSGPTGPATPDAPL